MAYTLAKENILDILRKFGMDSAKSIGTPINTSAKLDRDTKGKPVDQKLYRGIIGSLLYLTASRLDIMFSTCICVRFQSDPRESHLSAVKRILRYFVGTKDFGL